MPRFEYESQQETEGVQSTPFSVMLDQLKLIRNHRLVMATHSWQRQRRVLGELVNRLEQLKHEIQERNVNYGMVGKTQLAYFAMQRMPLSEINKWLEKERHALSEIQRVQKKLDALNEDIQLQRSWVEESYEKMIRLQCQVEKLNCMGELT
ncbi:hypothetical protein [Pseudomonas fluorescens]|uniref:hypothetical protein n=1 Tax=Pseudomonas fluorescens TaxID=294 RepID=UPI001BEB1DC3|nr:hypothetical protein [Pseudomonas fluorescens]MBT2375464.1 hypothetical protein [Pseudomonas fluorescens]